MTVNARYLAGQLIPDGGWFDNGRDRCGHLTLADRHQCVPLYKDHDPDLGTFGHLVHLERSQAGIVAVFDLADGWTGDTAGGRQYLSPRLTKLRHSQVPVVLDDDQRYEWVDGGELVEVSLVDEAGAARHPYATTGTDLTFGGGGYTWSTPTALRAAFDRSADTMRDRRYSRSTTVTVIDVENGKKVAKLLHRPGRMFRHYTPNALTIR